MQLIVIHNNISPAPNHGLLQFAISNKLIADVTFNNLGAIYGFGASKDRIIAFPENWKTEVPNQNIKVIYYNHLLKTSPRLSKQNSSNHWIVISNGRFATSIDNCWLNKIVANITQSPRNIHKNRTYVKNDLVTVDVVSELSSYREKIQFTSDGNIAGFRRIHNDSILPTVLPCDWPHHIFIKSCVLNKILVDSTLPLSFSEFVNRCKDLSVNWHCFKIGGAIIDLETESGLLNLITARLKLLNKHSNTKTNNHKNSMIAPNTQIYGKVIFGDNVQIDKNIVIVGPAIIADNVKIASGSTVKNSVIGPGLLISKNSLIQNRILIDPKLDFKLNTHNIYEPRDNHTKSFFTTSQLKENNFRTWPRLSYTRCAKRFIDIMISLIMLILFVPIFPIIVTAIKLSSPGPAFFKHKRQGRYGRNFFCLKFRTMIIGADKFQEKLKALNQVDGPQFKVKDDPRVTIVGRYLRDTFIDELPQFINVLFGQMSVVGPRPSPNAENSLCPFWQDAKLSVRPGITGLWQICRTRKPGHDFQEWIYYDIKYIKNLSLRLDLWICWQTAKKLIADFIKQF